VLSPLLFIIYINPLLTLLRKSGNGYVYGNNKDIHVPNITYVDDISLIAESPEKLQKLVEMVENFGNHTGLHLNQTHIGRDKVSAIPAETSTRVLKSPHA